MLRMISASREREQERLESYMKRKKAVGVRLRLESLLAAAVLEGFLRSDLVTSTVFSTTCASEEEKSNISISGS